MTRGEVGQLYASYAPAVFRRARRFFAQESDAWDVVQEVFERMLRTDSQFRGEASPLTWLWRVTTNVCLNRLRGAKLRRAEGGLGPDSAAPDAVAGSEVRQLLSVWLEQLTEREQEVATLLYIDGLTQDEVAEVLNLSRKTIGREVAELRAKAEALGALPAVEPI